MPYPVAAVRSKGGPLPFLPYIFNPALVPDGALPSEWSGATYLVSGGQAINSPTEAAEKLADANFEGAYTGGLAANWSAAGSPTLAQSADAHGGSKAQEFQGATSSDYISQYGTVDGGTWAKFSVWGKRLSGSADDVFSQAISLEGSVDRGYITTPDYSKLITTGYASGWIGCRVARSAYAGVSDDVVVDDASCVNLSGLYAVHKTKINGNIDLRVKVSAMLNGTQVGGALRLDSLTNPTAGVLFYLTGTTVVCIQFTGTTTITSKITGSKTFAANDTVRLTLNGNSISLYHITSGGVSTLIGTATTTVTADGYFGLFTTYSGNQIAELQALPF